VYTSRPAEFAYRRPSTVEEAVTMLGESDEARPLAGGHSLLPMMKLRLSTPETLVDLGGIPGLDGIAEHDGGLELGALATHAAVEESELVRERCPVLAETAGGIGDLQVRNRGTIGGSVSHADPAADYPTLLKALGASISALGPGGEREIAADDFFVDLFETALDPGELVVSVRVPATPAGTGAAYAKHSHPASNYAVVGVAAVVTVEGGSCTSARLTVGGAVRTPVHATSAAEALAGAAAGGEDAIAAAAERVAGALPSPIGDQYASGEYRVHLAQVLAKRALLRALDRAA
jgi:carbon-monoxide dehydrogenase medium subunit